MKIWRTEHAILAVTVAGMAVASALTPTSISAQEGCGAMTPEEALEEVRRTYMEAFNAGDADAVADLHAEDALHLPAGMPPVRGRSAIRELTASSLERMPPEASFAFEAREVRIADGWAVERGVTAAGEGFPSGKYVMLYEREEDGCWRIAWSITNSDAPPPGR
jgi:uncharacterized protein (TIGR02246 family)